MKKKLLKTTYYLILFILLAIVLLVQHVPGLGERYARSLYPGISNFLSSLSGWIPFSLGDVFIFGSIAGLIVYPFIARQRKKRWKRILLNMGVYLVWVYIWFYLAWGLNYSQNNFYQRTNTEYAEYSSESFQNFLDEYIAELNESYVPITAIDKARIHREVIAQYGKLGNGLGIHTPQGSPRVKTMLLTPLFSKMGISGYMGPFFCEFNLNGDLLPSQYASTYAHELAHLLGITSEAEANFYAYQVCTHSSDPTIRFCGYFSVMNYVLGNARGFLSNEKYIKLISSIRPEIIDLNTANRKYWQEKYSPIIGDAQEWLYNLYLKGNKIDSGTKNYSEVVGLLVSWRENQ